MSRREAFAIAILLAAGVGNLLFFGALWLFGAR